MGPLPRFKDGDHGRAQRRGYWLRAYVGANGTGKSAAMVHDIQPSLDMGRMVLSTVTLLDTRADCLTCKSPSPCGCAAPKLPVHPNFKQFTDYRQLVDPDLEHCDVLMDEITGIASSRESASLPVQVVNFLQQLRRRDITLSWTGVGWGRCDKALREPTQAVTVCRAFLPKARAESDRLWKDNRLLMWSTYDAADFEEWTLAKRERLRRACRGVVWRPGSRFEAAYDTLDAVSSLGYASEAGMCMACGGRRAMPKCSCKVESRDSLGL